jgi:hypothetical protein
VEGYRDFDEVMIVNPFDPTAGFEQGVKLMGYPYTQIPNIGYYGQPVPPPEGYGYFADEPYYQPYGYYAATPEEARWGQPESYPPYGPGYGHYQAPYVPYEPYGPVGYYADEYLPTSYGDEYPLGYYAEDFYPPVGDYEPTAGWYGQPPVPPEYSQYGAPAEEYPAMGYYGGPEYAGYVRDVPPTFNAGCPLPTNVAGFGADEPLEGYVRPTEVSPTCERFTPQPGPTPSVPETFRPLWE